MNRSTAQADVTGVIDSPSSTGAWHLIVGEYPPQLGGVADYTRHMATALARLGKEVHVWCGGSPTLEETVEEGVHVHRTAGRFGPLELRQLSRRLNAFASPRTIFVQYVPNAFGWKAMNVFFAAWLLSFRGRNDDLRIMFHEAAQPFVPRPFRHNVLAVAHRLMLALMLAARPKIYVSTPAWIPILARYGRLRDAPIWLPVFANIDHVPDSTATLELRRRYFGPAGRQIIGHFGTFASHITRHLTPVIKQLLDEPNSPDILLLGRGAQKYRETLTNELADASQRIVAVENPTSDETAALIRTCDLMIQPFSEGVTTRRSSVMACLFHGVPLVTTDGALTEPLWRQDGFCLLAPVGDPGAMVQLIRSRLNEPEQLASLGAEGKTFYNRHFSLRATLARLIDATSRATSPLVAS